MIQRSISPFPLAGSTFASSNALSSLAASKTSKLSLTSLISGAQKTIGTVNQIIPLYKQVQPLINNSKTIINAAKNIKFPSINKNKRKYNIQSPIDVSIIKEESKEEPQKKQTNEPSKPFFA